MSSERPYVTINIAVTADGKTDTIARRGAAISSAADFQRVDELRAASDAVLVGAGTLRSDDPRLTVKTAQLRLERQAQALPENPAKVAIISDATIPLDGRFLNTGPARILIYTSERTSQRALAALRQHGAEVFIMGRQQVDLVAAFASLRQQGVARLLVEGGGTLNAALLRLGLIDEIQLYLAPIIFGGASAPTMADGPGLQLDQSLPLQRQRVTLLADGGILVTYVVPDSDRKENVTESG